MQTGKKFRYPLGGDLYAYVDTGRRDGVKIHIRHFQLGMNTKGGVKPTSKGVKMDAKTLRRLFAMKKQLTEEFKLQTAKAKDVKPRVKKVSCQQTKACERLKRGEAPEVESPLLNEQRSPEVTPPLRNEQRPRKKMKGLRLQLPEEPELRQQISWPPHLTEPAQYLNERGEASEAESPLLNEQRSPEVTPPLLNEQRPRKKMKGLRLQLPEEPELRQQIAWSPHLTEPAQYLNDNNYPAAFMDVGALTPRYSYNAT